MRQYGNIILLKIILVIVVTGTYIYSQDSKLAVAYRYPVWNLNPFKAQDKESRDVCELIYTGLIGIDNAHFDIRQRQTH